MYPKLSSIDTAQIAAGAAPCAILGIVLVTGLGRAPAGNAPAEAPMLRAARYQPADGEPSAQVRQARNEAMTTAEGALIDHCPRCR